MSELEFARARSGSPSRLKSLTATRTGPLPTPTGEPAGGVKPPIPSPNRIVTVLEFWFAVARSGLPSRLKSLTATEKGPAPTPTGEPAGWVKPPLPPPNNIVTVLETRRATERAGSPARLRSPTDSKTGSVPTPTGEPAGWVKAMPEQGRASQVLSRIVTLLESAFAVARSGLPSRLKSPTATEKGLVPTSTGEPAGVKPPIPSPSKIVTLPVSMLRVRFATARSGLPSTLKRAIGTDRGLAAEQTGESAVVKQPIQTPNKIVTVLEKKFAVARSGLPSRLKSPTTTELGPDPTSTGEPWGCVKPPIPSPNKIVTVESAEFAVARSGLPSRL